MIWSPAASPASPPATLSLFPTPQPLPLKKNGKLAPAPGPWHLMLPPPRGQRPQLFTRSLPLSHSALGSRAPLSLITRSRAGLPALPCHPVSLHSQYFAPSKSRSHLFVRCPSALTRMCANSRAGGSVAPVLFASPSPVPSSGGVKWVISPARPLSLCRPSLSSHAPACGRNVTCLHISAEGPCPACCPVGKAWGAGLHLRFGRAPRLNCNAVQITGCPREAVRPRFHGRFRR